MIHWHLFMNKHAMVCLLYTVTAITQVIGTASRETFPNGHIWAADLDCSNGGMVWAEKGLGKVHTFPMKWSGSIWTARMSGPKVLPHRNVHPSPGWPLLDSDHVRTRVSDCFFLHLPRTLFFMPLSL